MSSTGQLRFAPAGAKRSQHSIRQSNAAIRYAGQPSPGAALPLPIGAGSNTLSPSDVAQVVGDTLTMFLNDHPFLAASEVTVEQLDGKSEISLRIDGDDLRILIQTSEEPRVHAAPARCSLPADLLAELQLRALETGEIIEKLGFVDSPVMRKMVARELENAGFMRHVRRRLHSIAIVKVWTPRPERSQ